MSRRTQSALVLALGAVCMTLGACDSKGTREVKQQAKAIDHSYEAQADLVEAGARYAPDNDAAEAKADALRDKGEAIKDHLIDEAKEVQRETRAP